MTICPEKLMCNQNYPNKPVCGSSTYPWIRELFDFACLSCNTKQASTILLVCMFGLWSGDDIFFFFWTLEIWWQLDTNCQMFKHATWSIHYVLCQYFYQVSSVIEYCKKALSTYYDLFVDTKLLYGENHFLTFIWPVFLVFCTKYDTYFNMIFQWLICLR